MESGITQLLEGVLPQLGVSAIFIAVAAKLYKDLNTKMAEKDCKHAEEIASKDERINEITGMLVKMYEKNAELYARNTEVMTQLKDIISTQSENINRNTEALVSLEKKIIKIAD